MMSSLKYHQEMVSHGFKVVQDFAYPQYFRAPLLDGSKRNHSGGFAYVEAN